MLKITTIPCSSRILVAAVDPPNNNLLLFFLLSSFLRYSLPSSFLSSPPSFLLLVWRAGSNGGGQLAGLAHLKPEYAVVWHVPCIYGIFRLNSVRASWHPCRAIPLMRTFGRRLNRCYYISPVYYLFLFFITPYRSRYRYYYSFVRLIIIFIIIRSADHSLLSTVYRFILFVSYEILDGRT